MWPNPQLSADLVTFTEEIFNGKRYLFYFFLFILFLFIDLFFIYAFIYLFIHQQQLTNGSSVGRS